LTGDNGGGRGDAKRVKYRHHDIGFPVFVLPCCPFDVFHMIDDFRIESDIDEVVVLTDGGFDFESGAYVACFKGGGGGTSGDFFTGDLGITVFVVNMNFVRKFGGFILGGVNIFVDGFRSGFFPAAGDEHLRFDDFGFLGLDEFGDALAEDGVVFGCRGVSHESRHVLKREFDVFHLGANVSGK